MSTTHTNSWMRDVACLLSKLSMVTYCLQDLQVADPNGAVTTATKAIGAGAVHVTAAGATSHGVYHFRRGKASRESHRKPGPHAQRAPACRSRHKLLTRVHVWGSPSLCFGWCHAKAKPLGLCFTSLWQSLLGWAWCLTCPRIHQCRLNTQYRVVQLLQPLCTCRNTQRHFQQPSPGNPSVHAQNAWDPLPGGACVTNVALLAPDPYVSLVSRSHYLDMTAPANKEILDQHHCGNGLRKRFRARACSQVTQKMICVVLAEAMKGLPVASRERL